ncbi:MAG: diadenylate cyclase CdaA [Thermaerobacter sp.]|nr:diadenylate cyclase CdaA [Thermaerobacter sp.]
MALRSEDLGFIAASLADIAIVAYIFFRIILLIRGTRAVQLVKGIALLLLATPVAGWLHLVATHWLLQTVQVMLVVALPVVFQPELRRALEQLGRGRLFTRSLLDLGKADQEQVLGEVAGAAFLLARRRVGALLVLERETGLREYVESGVRLDARVSAELIRSIFEPNTPLHDGAVIIRGNRLAAAACFLPFPDRGEVARELGSRHRAALGVTDHSDALAVVVSEETGRVSLAQGGVLTRDLDEAALRQRLDEAFRGRKG